MSSQNWTANDDLRLKKMMLSVYGEVNYTRLASEVGSTRQSLYNMRTGRINNSEATIKLVKDWMSKNKGVKRA